MHSNGAYSKAYRYPVAKSANEAQRLYWRAFDANDWPRAEHHSLEWDRIAAQDRAHRLSLGNGCDCRHCAA